MNGRLARLWIVIGCAAAVGCGGSEESIPIRLAAWQPESQPAAVVPDGGSYLGPVGCMTTTCHGAAISADTWQTPDIYRASAGIWAHFDAHAGAYDVLFTDRAERMVGLLATAAGADPPPLDSPHYARILASRCNSCHATPLPANAAADSPSPWGVSCESCHGPAEGWLDAHRQTDWTSGDSERKAALGFRDMSQAVVRAATCVSCHVGDSARGRDVNHDLIAAGHPRLQFDYEAYFANLPRHWPAKDPAVSLRDAQLGEAVAVRGTLQLLADRAQAAVDDDSPWPEFSEYRCFGCHFDLRAPTSHDDSATLGVWQWRPWETALLVPSQLDSPQMQQVAQLMNHLSARPEEVIEAARSALSPLDQRIATLASLDPASIDPQQRWQHWVQATESLAVNLPWEQAARFQLALTACNDARQSGDTPPPTERARQILDKMYEQILDFPRATNEAAQYTFDSPKHFDSKAFHDACAALRALQ